MTSIHVADETMDEISKIQEELRLQFRMDYIPKDRVIIELLSEYRKVHPEPPAPPEPEKASKKSKSAKRKGPVDRFNVKVDRD